MFKISTVDGKKPHYHLLFVTDDSIECAEANGHKHIVEIVTTGIDPATGMPIQLEVPEIIFSEDQEHVHYYEGDEVPIAEEKADSQPESEKTAEIREMYKAACESERRPRKKAKEAYDFYRGDQWLPEHKDMLTEKRRTSLTINHIENAVDTLSGYFRQNRTDFKFFGVENSDNVTADIMTEVVRNICERNEFAHVETKVFEDEVIAGRGVFHSYIDTDSNVEGDIVIEHYEWDEVRFASHNKADGSDAEHAHKSKWYSKDKLKNLYPDKADLIQADYDAYEDSDDTHFRLQGRQYEVAFAELGNPVKLEAEFVDQKKKQYRVIETEQKKYERVPILTRIDVEDPVNAGKWERKDLNAAKDLGFSVIRRPNHKIRVTKIAGNVLLEDYIEELKDFSITPVYAKKMKDDWYGKVESAKDPQRELNKLRSQQADIINKMVANGWFIDRNTFTNPVEKQKFQSQSSSAGFVSELNDLNKPPLKVESDPMPSGLVQALEMSRGEIKAVLNIQPEVLNSKSTSGLAIIQGQKMALLGSEFLYDNMAQSKKRLGQRIVHLIQQIYTPDRIMRILVSNAQRKQVEIGGQPFNPQDQQMKDQLYEVIKQALDNEELTKLDLVVGETSHSPNKQLADFSMLLEMARVTGGGIPIEQLIQTSPLAEDQKQRALQSIQQQKQAAAQAEQQKQQAEIQKSMPDEMKMVQAMGGGRPPMT